jgi:Baseplate J-like protein
MIRDSLEQDIAQLLEPEDAQTYHVYPLNRGIFIRREGEPFVDTTPPRKPSAIPCIIATLWSLIFILFLVIFPNTAPTQQFTVRHSFTLPSDLQSRILPYTTLRQFRTSLATGRIRRNATYALGFITFYNGSFTDQLIPQNMIFTGANGIQVVTQMAVSVPSGNPPNYGAATVQARALRPGVAGNIPQYSVDTTCCAIALKAVNLTGFTGGRDAQDFSIVTTRDIDNGVTPLKNILLSRMKTTLQKGLASDDIFIPLPCSVSSSTNYHAGEKAKSVTLSVSATCTAIVYSRLLLEEEARKLIHVPTGYILRKIAIGSVLITHKSKQIGVTLTIAVTATALHLPINRFSRESVTDKGA